MTDLENLYIVAMEECSEIQQCISKILRFGEFNHHPHTPLRTNASKLLEEYYQLQAVMDMIISRGMFGRISDKDIELIKTEKIRKVKDWASISESIGRINKED